VLRFKVQIKGRTHDLDAEVAEGDAGWDGGRDEFWEKATVGVGGEEVGGAEGAGEMGQYKWSSGVCASIFPV
jgi:hypothetical protein